MEETSRRRGSWGEVLRLGIVSLGQNWTTVLKRRTWRFLGKQGACVVVVYYTNCQSESRRFAFPAPGPLRWWRGGEEAAGWGGAEGSDRGAEETPRCLSYHGGSWAERKMSKPDDLEVVT